MRDLRDVPIALIGGAGFIGHNLALALRGLGAEVHIVDSLLVNNLLSLTSGDRPAEQRNLYLRMVNQRLDLLRDAGIPIHTQDARDYHALCRILGDIRPRIVVHLAAVANANLSNKDPHSTFDHSLRTLENALDNARSSNLAVEHFVFFSSSMVYGDFGPGAVDEDARCEPKGIYGALKLAGEHMVKAYHQVFDLPYTIIRPSALYGERCVSRRVAQLFIESALTGREVRIDGDGSDRLDFTYIQDLVDGTLRVLRHPAAKNQTFNITYGQGRSLRDLLDIVRAHFPDLTVASAPRDRLMPSRGTLCIQKTRDLLGYSPRWPLERGLERYVKWYRDLFAKTVQPEALALTA